TWLLVMIWPLASTRKPEPSPWSVSIRTTAGPTRSNTPATTSSSLLSGRSLWGIGVDCCATGMAAGAAALGVLLPSALTGFSSEVTVGWAAAVGAGGLVVAAPSNAPVSLPLHPANATAASKVIRKRVVE